MLDPDFSWKWRELLNEPIKKRCWICRRVQNIKIYNQKTQRSVTETDTFFPQTKLCFEGVLTWSVKFASKFDSPPPVAAGT